MRTLASTFSTKDEAEAACARLEAIGVARERIILKDVAPAGEGGGGSAGAVFMSVKVTTEQVEPVNEILKRGRGGVEAPMPEAPSAPQAAPIRPKPSTDAGPAPVVPRVQVQPEAQPEKRPVTGKDRARIGRYLIFYGLALVAAFIFGAMLGLVS